MTGDAPPPPTPPSHDPSPATTPAAPAAAATPRRPLSQRLIDFLDPVAVFGPVFQKEIRTQGRRASTYVSRFTYPMLLLAVLTLSYVSAEVDTGSSSGAARSLQRLQMIAPVITVVILWFQYIVLNLVAPSATGGAIADERQKRSLDSLLTTPIRPWQIILGKLASGMVTIIILSLTAIPILLAIRVFGGVSAVHIIAGTAIGLASALAAAAAGLLFSIWTRRSSVASLLGLVSLVVVNLIPFLGVLTFAMRGGPPGPIAFGVFSCCGPFALAMITADVFGGGPAAFITPERTAAVCVAYHLVLTLVLVLVASFVLRRVMVRTAAGEVRLQTVTLAPEPVRRGPTPTAGHTGALLAPASDDPDALPARPPATKRRALRAVSREVSDAPVAWRELRQPLFKKAWMSWVAVAAVGLLLLWADAQAIADGYIRDASYHIVLMVIASLLVLVQAANLSATGVSGEREARTWEVLLTTPMSGWQILGGKFLGAIRRLWLIPAIALAHTFFAGIMTGALHPISLLHLMIIWTTASAFLAASGTLLSLIIRKSAVASIVNLALALVLWAAVPIVAALVFELILDARSYPDIKAIGDMVHTAWFSLNPVLMSLVSIDGASLSDQTADFWASRRYWLSFENSSKVGSLGFTGVVAVFAGVYLLAAWGLLAVAVRLFRTRGGRVS